MEDDENEDQENNQEDDQNSENEDENQINVNSNPGFQVGGAMPGLLPPYGEGAEL